MATIFYLFSTYWLLDYYNLNDKWWSFALILAFYCLIKLFEYIVKEANKPANDKEDIKTSYKNTDLLEKNKQAQDLFKKFKK